MNIVEAFEEMKKGKKVRRKMWGLDKFVHLDENGDVRNGIGNLYTPALNIKIVDDWEISNYLSASDLKRRGKLLTIYVHCREQYGRCDDCILAGAYCNDYKSFNCFTDWDYYLRPENYKMLDNAYDKVINSNTEGR